MEKARKMFDQFKSIKEEISLNKKCISKNILEWGNKRK